MKEQTFHRPTDKGEYGFAKRAEGLNMCLPFVLPPRPTQTELPNEYQIDRDCQCNGSVAVEYGRIVDPKREAKQTKYKKKKRNDTYVKRI